VRDQVGNNLDYPFEDMGEQSVKNIRRPVRTYAISAAAVAATPLVPLRPPPRIIPWRAIGASLAAALVVGLVAWWVWSIGGVWNEAEALRKGQEQENQRIEERHAEQIEGQKRLERLIQAAASGTASVQALAEIRVLLSQEIPGIKEAQNADRMCQPCPRTPVHYLPSPYRPRGKRWGGHPHLQLVEPQAKRVADPFC
jgi:hypothetical protein